MPKKQPAVKQVASDWRAQSLMSLPSMMRIAPLLPAGQTLPQPTVPVGPRNLGVIKRPEVPDSIALFKLGALSGWGEPYNMSTTLDAVRIQAAIRAAERGDTWQLFTIFRDMIAGYTHLQNEFAKRKLTVVGQPHAVLPKDKNSAADKKAVKIIEEMIDHCDNWHDALDNMLDATLWPVSVSEKLFAPVEASDLEDYEFPVRYRLRKLDPVSPTLFCYKIPYLAAGFGGAFATGLASGQAMGELSPQTLPLGPNQAYWNPDDWEPELRFYEVFQNGYPNFSPASTYQPEQARHIIHRGTNLSKTIRDNFGGHLRAILFWWFLAISGRDWFGRYMQRWGHPFIVGKVDAQQHDTLTFMQNALSLATEIGGLIIDKDAEASLMQAASLNGAEGYRLFLEVCNDEVSKVVVGQTLSSTARSTGLGSGVARLHGEVRNDYRQSDMRKLSSTLVKQLFRHFLKINAIKGSVRGIIWGGKDETQAELLARTMKDFNDAGIEADDSGVDTISERVGISLRRIPIEQQMMLKGGGGNGKGGRERPQKAQVKSFNVEEQYEYTLDELVRDVHERDRQIASLREEIETLQPLIHPKSNGNGFGGRMLKV